MRDEIVLIILGMAVVTFFTRFGSLALFRKTGMPASWERWLRHLPTGMLTALIIPTLLLPGGNLDLSLHNPYLIAGLIAALVAYKSKNATLTMVLGMATMLVLRWSGV